MKILMYGWEFPPRISGGLGIACYGIVQGLLANGVQVTLVLPQSVQDFSQDNLDPAPLAAVNEALNAKLITIKRFPSLIKPYMSEEVYQQTKRQVSLPGEIETDSDAEMESGGSPDYARFSWGGELAAEVVRYALRTGQVAGMVEHDVIHAHDWLTVLAGLEAKAISHKPLIFHVHSLETDRSGEHGNSVIFEIEKYGLEKADKIIAVSHYTKNVIVSRYHIAPEKIAVVHNGLFSSEFTEEVKHKEARIKTALFLGRVTYQKGPFYFIEAASRIVAQRKDIQFVLAGEGDLLESMIEHVAALRLGQYVHFTGFLDRKSVERIYRLSSVYVMPSVSEPFGISCLEALSHHVPVIISKQSGVSEVLPAGITVDFWDINELAAKIIALIDHPKLQMELLENSSRELSKLSWHNTANNIMQVYQRVLP